MEISLRFIGKNIVELTVDDNGDSLTSDISDLNGIVPIDFIDTLKGLVYDLESHNEKVINNNK